jgi:hypothetical protein
MEVAAMVFTEDSYNAAQAADLVALVRRVRR